MNIKDSELREEARQIFSNLLRQETHENQWQLFFKQFPFVFSDTLQLKLSPNDIIFGGRIGISEPDFIFYNKSNPTLTTYGLIELKKPSTKLLTIPRKNIIRLSSDAQTAVAQSKFYASKLNKNIIHDTENTLVMGNRAYVFMIIGLSDEISLKITNNILSDQYNNLLPPGFQIIPYDTLYKLFCQKVPPKIFHLVPKWTMLSSYIPLIYYNEQGLTLNVQEDYSSQYLGLISELVNGQKRFKIETIGHCLYCGKKDGFESLSKIRVTPLGSFQVFITDDYMGFPSRLLRCNRFSSPNGEDLLFREIYDNQELQKWYIALLNNKKCNRCGSLNVSFHEFDNMPEQKIERAVCDDCGFYQESHVWGPSSAGA